MTWLVTTIAHLEHRLAADKPYRGKFRFTHEASILSLKGMNLEKPEKLRGELESILQSVVPKAKLGKPKTSHFNMYGRSISAHYYPISPPEAFLHSGGAEDPSTIRFQKAVDALTNAGFVRGKSKKKKKAASTTVYRLENAKGQGFTAKDRKEFDKSQHLFGFKSPEQAKDYFEKPLKNPST